MRLLQVFHEDSDNHVDQDKLGHQDEDHEEERGEESGDAAVLQTVRGGVALLPDGVLHDPVPVVSWPWENGKKLQTQTRSESEENMEILL